LSQSQAANLCIVKQGMEACPTGFPNGTSFAYWPDDTRSCGPCSCGSSLSCTLNGVLLDTADTCALGHPYLMTVTTSCTTGSSSYPVSGVKGDATSSGSPSCVETSASIPMGSVGLNHTMCCK
jgi:hypothetical protein